MKNNNLIQLPPGHNWKEINIDSTHTDFICECSATFSIDLTDNSIEFEEGEGHENEEGKGQD